MKFKPIYVIKAITKLNQLIVIEHSASALAPTRSKLGSGLGQIEVKSSPSLARLGSARIGFVHLVYFSYVLVCKV